MTHTQAREQRAKAVPGQPDMWMFVLFEMVPRMGKSVTDLPPSIAAFRLD